MRTARRAAGAQIPCREPGGTAVGGAAKAFLEHGHLASCDRAEFAPLPEVVVARDVPPTPLELEAVRIDGAVLVAVPKADRPKARHRPEEARQVRIGGEGRDVHPEVA